MSDNMNYHSLNMRRENQFWLRIFRDHCQFMLETLVPRETALIAQTQGFYQTFDHLLQHADRDIQGEAAQAVMQFRCFQLSIVDLQLAGQIPINLPPAALNEMLDEADEYLHILGMHSMSMPMNEAHHLIHQHLLWLPNNAAHAALAAAQVDPGEATFVKIFNRYQKRFHQLELKVRELQGLMRDNPRMVPSLVYTTQESMRHTREFIQLQENYRGLRTNAQVLGISPPLLADHFIREATYYLEKIS